MRVSIASVIFMILSACTLSCGGGSEQETADSPATDAIADTATAEEPVITAEAEQLQEIMETALVTESAEGVWSTTMGQLYLEVDDSGNVTGEYPLGTIEGTMTGNILQFTYSEGSLSGEGTFTFSEGFSSFTGVQDISGTEVIWDGMRLQII